MDDSPTTALEATLETERLLLRPIRPEDTAFAVRHFTDPAVHRFMLDDEPMALRADAQRYHYGRAGHGDRALLRRHAWGDL